MSSDSIDQLQQGRSGHYEPHHPPVMAWVWGRIDEIHRGPLGMLLLQNLLFWSALALLFTLLNLPVRPAMLLCVGLWPASLALLGTIWKDVQMAASLLAAFSLIYAAARLSRRWPLYLALPPLFYGFAVRSNGVLAVLPLAIWGADVGWARSLGRTRAWLIGVGATATLGGVVVGANAALTPGRSSYGFQQAMLHDLVALSIVRARNLLPVEEPALELERMRALYQPAASDPLFWPPDRGSGLHFVGAAEIRGLVRTWFRAVLASPTAYLRHRLRYLKCLVGLDGHSHYPFHQGIDPNSLRLVYSPSRANHLLMPLLERVKDSWLFRPWVYLLCSLASFAWAAWRRSRALPEIAALTTSSLLNLVSYAVFGPASDFRYLWWSVLAGVLAPFLLAGAMKPIRGVAT